MPPKKSKKDGYIFNVPKNDPSLLLEEDDDDEEEEEGEIKGVPKGFNFEDLHGSKDDDDDKEEEMLKKLLDEKYDEEVSKKAPKAKEEDNSSDEDDDVLLGLKPSNDDDEEMNPKEEEEEEDGLSLDTLSALDSALTVEKKQKKSARMRNLLRELSEGINADSSVGTLPSDAPAYPGAKRVGNYQIVKTKKASTSLSDRGPSSTIKDFLNSRFYGNHIERMPAHVVVKNGKNSKQAIGTKYKVRAKNLKVQRLHAAQNGKLSNKQAGIVNPNAHRPHLPPKRR